MKFSDFKKEATKTEPLIVSLCLHLEQPSNKWDVNFIKRSFCLLQKKYVKMLIEFFWCSEMAKITTITGEIK